MMRPARMVSTGFPLSNVILVSPAPTFKTAISPICYFGSFLGSIVKTHSSPLI